MRTVFFSNDPDDFAHPNENLVSQMNTALLVAAVLVIPLFWGYVAEQLMRRLWPESSDDRLKPKADRDRQQDYFDFQI